MTVKTAFNTGQVDQFPPKKTYFFPSFNDDGAKKQRPRFPGRCLL